MGPEARGACPEELVEGQEPQGLGLRAGRVEEHRLPGNPQHFLPLLSPLPIREEVGPGYSLGLRGETGRGSLQAAMSISTIRKMSGYFVRGGETVYASV